MPSPAKTPLAKTVNFAPDAVDRIGRALGAAWAQHWSRLPQELQHDIFAAAVHGKHHRTIDSLHARSLSEPDSLGG